MNGLTLVQLTDTHIRPGGEQVLDKVDTFATLNRVLDQLRTGGRTIEALLLTGDLADHGSPEAYRMLRAAVEPVAAELGAQVLYAMGNHDERTAFAIELLGREPGTVDPAQPIDQAIEVSGLRIIALDSTTPGLHNGKLEDEQLDWLADQLSRPAPRGTVLVLHHPPLPSAIAAAEVLKLQQAERLAAVVAGTDVRMILCGHNHMTAAAALAGIPVWVGPAMAYRLDAMAPAGRQRAVTGSGYSRIDVVGATVIATAVEVAAATVIYDRDEAGELDRLAPYVAHSG
ncbi:metallophosphoesterase [Nocardia sp. NBC_01503]|uniref:metallophosphoesterase n=1 Tax=Nocardia sp. NBC_01503 TaxID=2975997 RepID=UPI002E7AFC36|nr:metallophosphoesterase [Nocardia sp. NBC_01503]WTL31767.1 metallophosphoesterase [Nocardia sp. NBC_01503]